MSIARETPIRRGSRTVPPSISGTPHRRQNTPNTAPSSATRRSHHSASSSPPATAYPATAAITGLPSRIRVGPIGPSPSGATRLPAGLPTSFRSAPEQNTPPSPCRTATAASRSASNSRNASDQRRRGRAVDRVPALGARQQHGRDGTVALDPEPRAHAGAPIARRTNVRIDPTTSSADGSTDDSGPTSASPQPPTSAAAVNATSCVGDLAGRDRGPQLGRDQRCVALAVGQALGVDELVDRLGQERPGQPWVLQRPAGERRQHGLEPVDRGRRRRRSAAATIARSSSSHTARNTSRNRSSFDGKWRYSVPGATPARSAIAATDAEP